MTKKNAFTLAEVLITLVIIGIIAAITVSTLSVNLQKEHIERCKKVYSTLSQAANRAISDNGPMHVWELTSDNQQENNRTFVENYILPYIITQNGWEFNGFAWTRMIVFLSGETNPI